MDISESIMSAEHRELHRSAAESADPSSVSPLEVRSPRSPRSPRGRSSPRGGSPGTSPLSPRSPRGKSSPVKNGKHSRSGRDGRPKKGGSGGKGTWGEVPDKEHDYYMDANDPNYDSNEENCDASQNKSSAKFQELKKKVAIIVEEYFVTDDIMLAANELTDLTAPSYHYYFVKKLVSTAMDRHDKEKEMAAVLLSSLYAEVIHPHQVYKGFCKLLCSSYDMSVDMRNAVDVLALFVARAVVGEILPPAFLTKQTPALLARDSKSVEVIKRAEKGYLSAPLHAETILRKWGGSKNATVDDVKAKINDLLIEYTVSGDKSEACRCIKDLKVPFFHHEIVKRALILAMERRATEGRILDLLKLASEEGMINASQISKGFNRVIDTVDDLSLDIPNARDLLQSLITKAASEGWLCASSLISLQFQPEKKVEDGTTKIFKVRATSIIQEYFLTTSIPSFLADTDRYGHTLSNVFSS